MRFKGDLKSKNIFYKLPTLIIFKFRKSVNKILLCTLE